MKIKSVHAIKQTFSIHKRIKLTYGHCSTCGRRDNDGGPMCGNIFCPGGN